MSGGRCTARARSPRGAPGSGGMVAASLVRRWRRLRSVPTGATPPPPAPLHDVTLPRGARLAPPVPTVAVLAARPDADAEGLVVALARTLATRGERPALLWTERTDTLDAGVVTTATSAALLPDALRPAAELCRVARIAHLGAGGEARAAEALFEGLDATHALLDGRMLGAVRAHLGVFVVGDGMGDDPPLVRALRDLCDVEVNEPSTAVAEALLRALARRA